MADTKSHKRFLPDKSSNKWTQSGQSHDSQIEAKLLPKVFSIINELPTR